jgi:hypothetical protein
VTENKEKPRWRVFAEELIRHLEREDPELAGKLKRWVELEEPGILLALAHARLARKLTGGDMKAAAHALKTVLRVEGKGGV